MALRSTSWCCAHSAWTWRLSLLFLFALAGCGDHIPNRIVFRADTMSPHVLRYRARPDSMLTVTTDGQVACRRTGDATVAVTAGNSGARLIVQCLLVAALQMGFDLGIPVGGAARPLEVSAFDERMRPMGSVRIGITVRDTSVVRLVHGMLKPMKFGRTFIEADGGGTRTCFMSRVSWSVVGLPKKSAIASRRWMRIRTLRPRGATQSRRSCAMR